MHDRRGGGRGRVLTASTASTEGPMRSGELQWMRGPVRAMVCVFERPLWWDEHLDTADRFRGRGVTW